jgi:methylmalonyl-CoA mutase
VQQVVAHRTSLEEDAGEAVLEKLAKVVESKGAARFEACVEAVEAGATIGEITRAARINDSPCEPIMPVCITRAAAGFERLREAVDRHVAQTGARPEVFLCNMGPLREHKARADFSRGFFAAGGYEAISSAGFKTPEEAAAAFGASKARVAVICSTDENYPALVPPLVKALRAKRADAIVVLAGYPQDQIEAHKAAGVDEFIHIRANAIDLLSQCHTRLGLECEISAGPLPSPGQRQS